MHFNYYSKLITSREYPKTSPTSLISPFTTTLSPSLIDIDRSHMSAIELANVGVSLDVIFKICEILNITEKELFDFR